MNGIPAGTRSVRLVVHGRVQGVGFRWLCARQAHALAIDGWITNRNDGSVEIRAQGAASAVTELIAWAHESPGWADVQDVRVNDMPLEQISGFDVR